MGIESIWTLKDLVNGWWKGCRGLPRVGVPQMWGWSALPLSPGWVVVSSPPRVYGAHQHSHPPTSPVRWTSSCQKGPGWHKRISYEDDGDQEWWMVETTNNKLCFFTLSLSRSVSCCSSVSELFFFFWPHGSLLWYEERIVPSKSGPVHLIQESRSLMSISKLKKKGMYSSWLTYRCVTVKLKTCDFFI